VKITSRLTENDHLSNRGGKRRARAGLPGSGGKIVFLQSVYESGTLEQTWISRDVRDSTFQRELTLLHYLRKQIDELNAG
jgi:hypothetical protein